MRNIRPPAKDFTNSHSNNNNSASRLRPPINNQTQDNNKNFNNNNPFQTSKPGPQFSNPNNSSYNNNEENYESSSEEENDKNIPSSESFQEQNNTPRHNTSQKHKTPINEYNINPDDIPRPNQYDEIYMNNEKLPYYETNIGTAPPRSTSFYSVKETQNSSCRYIRSTLNSVPISQSLLNETNLLFGICVQPLLKYLIMKNLYLKFKLVIIYLDANNANVI